jgi:hypothetical protein
MRQTIGVALGVAAMVSVGTVVRPAAQSSAASQSQYTAQILLPPPDLAGYSTQGVAMNNSGVVFGLVIMSPGLVPVLWTNGTPQRLPIPPGYHWTRTQQDFIDDTGTVVSTVAPDNPDSPGDQERVVIWKNGAAQFVPDSAAVCTTGRPQLPYGISRNGHVLILGYCNVNPLDLQLFIWDGANGFTPVPVPVIDPEDGVNMSPFTAVSPNKAFQIPVEVNALSAGDRYAAWTSTGTNPQVGGIISGATFTPVASGLPNGPNNVGEVIVDDVFNYSNSCPGRYFWNGTSTVFLGQSRRALLNDAGEVLIGDLGCSGSLSTQLYINGTSTDIDVTPSNIDLNQFSVGLPFLFNAKRQVVVEISSTDRFSSLSYATVLTPRLSAPPSITVPGSITAEATGPDGATVTYAASAVASDGSQVPISCTPHSGSLFPLGSTTVTCTAADNAGNQSQAGFTVTVQDTTPPLLAIPGNTQTPATSPAGAIVTFVATATDRVDPSPKVACLPASGSQFPIGSTVVTCVGADRSGNATSGAFTITVVGAAGQLANLVALVQSFNIQQGISNSLDTKLSAAVAALEQAASGDASGACGSVSGFVNEVQAQAGNKLTTAQASQLTLAANRIAATIGCR